MTGERDEAVDIPDPRGIPVPAEGDPARFDPGADEPVVDDVPGLGEDPAYDPGGMGRQPDVGEQAEEHA